MKTGTKGITGTKGTTGNGATGRRPTALVVDAIQVALSGVLLVPFVLFISQWARPAAAAEAPKIANKFEVLRTVRINPPSSRKHCAWPAAAHLGDGHIVVAYCDSVDHQQTAGGKLMVTESRNWGKTWAEPRQVLGGLPWHYSTTPPIWIRPDGALEVNVWAWRKRRDNERLATATYPKKMVDLFVVRSSNKGRTWQKAGPVPGTGDPLFRANDVAWCYGQVRTLKDGTLIRPAWGPSPQSDARSSMRIENAACLRREYGGQSWQGCLMLDGAPGKDRFNETDILALADGRLLAVIRNDSGKPYRLYSRDGGRTWEGASPIPFVMKCPTLHVLADGQIMLLCRSKDEKGYGFFAYLSADQGHSWTHRTRLHPGGGDCGYATVFDTPEKNLVVVAYVDMGGGNCNTVAIELAIKRR